jgi:hypothetical protein
MARWRRRLHRFFRLAEPLEEPPLLGDCLFSNVEAETKTASDTFAYYDRLRAYIQHEDDLISSRLTWSLTVHGFLFATYGILLGKIGDEFGQIDKCATPLLERLVGGLFLLQLPIALFGVIVGHQSRNAIAAAHNALMHLRTISLSSRNLSTIQTESKMNEEIVAGLDQRVTKPAFEIQKDSRLLIRNIHQGEEEIVTVKSLDGGKFVADFALDHPIGAAIRALGSMLLPNLVSGGAHGPHVEGARAYYLNLPLFATGLWLLLGLLSLFAGVAALGFPTWFFRSLGVPIP